MGTRSVVAVPTADGGWKGRYVHWDGYPEGVGSALAKIVQRDGYDTAVRVLTQDHYGWSSVTGEEHQELTLGYTDGRFEAVPGYGVAYTTKGGQSSPDEWITSDGDPGWTEYAYVLHPDSVRVLENTDSGWRDLFSRKYTDYDNGLQEAPDPARTLGFI